MKRKRALDRDFARRQSLSAQRWQKANPLRNALNQYKQGAKRRSLEWELTDEQFEALALSPCSFCGSLPRDINGVDRLDNTKGYTVANSVPACAPCNYAKRERSAEEFLAWAKQISDFQKEN
jgi:hypothetical protein